MFEQRLNQVFCHISCICSMLDAMVSQYLLPTHFRFNLLCNADGRHVGAISGALGAGCQWVLGASGSWEPVGAGCQCKNSFFIQAKLGFPLLMHLCALLMSTQVRNPIN